MALHKLPFRRGRGGHVLVSLAPEEAAVMRTLPAELELLLTGAQAGTRGVGEGQPAAGGLAGALDRADTGGEDPVRARLFPRAYLDPTEETAEAEWQALMHDELVREKLAALEAVVLALSRADTRRSRVEIDLAPDEAHAWLLALNDARLALGTRLGVTEELDLATVEPTDALAPHYALYGWLGWAQQCLVEALGG